MIDPNAMWARPIVIYDGFGDNRPVNPGFTDEELVSFLTSFPDAECEAATCVGKNCPAKTRVTSWSPASYADGATRDNANVLSINYAVFDLDHLKPGQLALVRAGLDDLEHVVHSTHSHDPARGDECYRLVFPLTRAVAPAEWPAVYDAVIRALDLPADPLGDLARLYAGPTSRAGVEPVALHRRGQPLDVDDALAAAVEFGLSPKQSAPPAVAPDPEPTTYDLGALRAALSEVRRSKAQGDDHAKQQAAVLGRVLDGEALAPVGERHRARVRAAGILAYWLPASTPWAVALEIMRPCLAATPLSTGETFEAAVAKTRGLYEDAMTGRLAADAKRAAENAALRTIADRVRAKSGAAATAEDFAEAAEEETGEENPEAWQQQLLLTQSGVRGCEYNARMILACASELRGTIRFNEVTKQVEVRGGPLEGVSSDVLPAAASAFMQKHYQFMGGAKLVAPALLQVARENPHDPVAEMLGEMLWDNVPRLDTFLERYFGAVVDTPERLKYVRAISRRWLISLVARALRPGCKVDTVLILEGAQGVKKSTALETLVGQPHFLDTALELGNKDTMQAIASAWLIELGELASLRKAETDRIKQFITSKVDKFRPPYGASTIDSPRRCVLAGTCNPENDGYLKDRTGNRRYWPVLVEHPDVDAIARDREFILAEAVKAFREGERWWLVGEEEILAKAETDERLEESPTVDKVSRWWYAEQPEKRMRRLTMLDVAELALMLPHERVDRGARIAIGHAMGELGFERRQLRVGNRRSWYYEPSEELLKAPRQTSAQRAAGIALVTDKGKKS